MTHNLPEGFTMRPAVLSDVQACTDLRNLYSESINDPSTYTTAQLEAAWTSHEMDIERNIRLVHTPSGQLVGFFAVVPQPSSETINLQGRVHPDYASMGISSHVMAWAETRAKEEIPNADPKARIAVRSSCSDGHDKAIQFLTDWGMSSVRYFWDMEIEFSGELLQPEFADGIELRPYDPEKHFEAVSQADYEAFRDHWGVPEETLENFREFWLHELTGNEFYDPTLWFILWDGDEVAGLTICDTQASTNPEHGYVDVVAVRRPWRRKGLATAMLRHAFIELQKRGKVGAALGVDADSLTGAVNVYKNAGMSPVRQYNVYEKTIRPASK